MPYFVPVASRRSSGGIGCFGLLVIIGLISYGITKLNQQGPSAWITAIVLLLIGLGVVLLITRAGSSGSGLSADSSPITSWQQAESVAARHMRSIGYTDARMTTSGSDGGIDVMARGAVAQVKWWAKPVGRPEVQQLKGSALHKTAIFYASPAGYTPAAMEWAATAQVALFLIRNNATITPVNTAARRVAVPPSTRPDTSPPTFNHPY